MRCPYCGYEESKVVDSRPTDEGEKIRRRRECVKCNERFTTYEIIELVPVIIIKKDGRREQFDRNKLLNGLLKACEGCQITFAQIEEIISKIEKTLQNSLNKEVQSEKIGDLVMSELELLDSVAYVRYASVYKEFKDVSSFMSELERLLKEKKF